MNNKYNNVFEEKIWNMDDLFTRRISERLNELDIATTNNNQFDRYRILKVIFMNTFFKYKDLKEHFENSFNDVSNVLKTLSTTNTNTARQHNSVTISHVEGLIDDLTFDIIQALYDVDLICLKKQNKKIEPTTNWS